MCVIILNPDTFQTRFENNNAHGFTTYTLNYRSGSNSCVLCNYLASYQKSDINCIIQSIKSLKRKRLLYAHCKFVRGSAFSSSRTSKISLHITVLTEAIAEIFILVPFKSIHPALKQAL